MQALKKGDLVAVVAPSGYVNPDLLSKGIAVLESWGLIVEKGKYLNKKSGYFSASDSERLHDLQTALNNPDYKAVFCARGGYGLSRIIDHIDFSAFKNHPKPVVGFSDITLLHLAIHKHGIHSIHACMVAQFSKEEYKESVRLLKNLLFTGKVSYPVKVPEGFPEKGKITGGNLRMVIDSLSTSVEIDTRNKVLFLEETGEGYYKIDRMLQHLKRAGKLKETNALITGAFTEVSDSIPSFEISVHDIICNAMQNNNPLVCTKFPAGHEAPNFPVVMGNEYVLVRKKGEISIHFEL